MSEPKIHPEQIESSKKEVIEVDNKHLDKVDNIKNSTKSESELKFYVSEPSDSDDCYIPNYSNEPAKKRVKIEIPKCPGCYPVFQPNQLGHIGPNGCLGDDC
jgi:gamma-glutamylcyclotransferase (GGCT)/AIG2-like uncharacterized protein YtfP